MEKILLTEEQFFEIWKSNFDVEEIKSKSLRELWERDLSKAKQKNWIIK